MRRVFLLLLLAGCTSPDSQFRHGQAPGNRLPFDAALWQAARETITAFPLAASDPVDGTIETGWGAPAELIDQQYKLSIQLDYTAITREAVSIGARHRLAADGGWVEVGPDPVTAARLAEAIEKRAEELHLETNPVTR